jgi:3-oxoacyl-[acyl-carrier-protein] synthase III
MALFSINNVRVAGISACVPKRNVSNADPDEYLLMEDLQKIMTTTGIENRRIVDKSVCTSDLCFKAAEKLIHDLAWDKSEIELLIFVSQTPDYILPMTSSILQDRLGLPKSCIAFDTTLGCSGYTYGLSIAGSMLAATRGKKGLLLVGDTISKITSPKDRSTNPLFGDAGTATALCFDEAAKPISFHLATDGSGSNAIVVTDGGQRNPAKNTSFEEKEIESGISRNACQLYLNGMDVFNFGISQAPKSVNELLSFTEKTSEDVDFFVFHQANKLMNETIRKKLKLTPQKVPYTLKDFGNTSSATIPLTIVTQLCDAVSTQSKSLVLCGFGVGLSWGSVLLNLDNIVCPKLIEI